MAEFVVTDPSGKEFIVNAPDGATQEQALEFAKSQFASTPGGAATGNPNIQRGGEKAMRQRIGMEPLLEVGGAAGLGGVMGAFSKEILGGAGNVIGALPYPAARTVGNYLKGASQVIGQGGRGAPTAVGALSGGAAETVGQVVDRTPTGEQYPALGEAARFTTGAVTPAGLIATKEILKTYVTKPALSLAMHMKKQMAKQILGKLEESPEFLTKREQEWLDAEIASLRGGAKSDAPLEEVGSLMGERGRNLMDFGDQQLIAAQQRALGVKPYGGQRELADVGGELQRAINIRYKGALEARNKEFNATKEARDAIVAQREAAGNYVNSTPEYQAVIESLQKELDNSKIMNRSPSVQASYQKILNDLTNPQVIEGEEKLVLSGQNLDLVKQPSTPKPISFQALDDVRRKLGDAFRGKPAEGYDAIGEQAAKDLYGKVSNIQKRFAGDIQTKLLDDYAERTEGLQLFSSKYGKKATALDQYREDTFANDPSTLPAAYFKTRASVKALQELVGNRTQVNAAALEYANRELAGKDSAAIRKWMSNNSEWLAETGPTRTLIDRYATKLEGVERSLRNAQDFAAQAAKDASLLTRQALPAQRAVDLIKSGDTELWAKVLPAIQQSPQAKKSMVNAVRQVVAEQASAKSTETLFSRNIRPFLEGAGIATRDEMDMIAGKLANIQALNVPDKEKLGLAKTMILQATGTWVATAGARAGVEGYKWTKEKMVPE